jgi:cytochrome c biogenesis protein CcmG/thiol:disulfide interchange protein DsbE
MKRTVALSVSLVVGLGLVLGVFLGTRQPVGEASETTSPLLGKVAPNFAATEIGTNTSITLKSLRGRVVVLNFWASWCSPCQAEGPELSTFAWQHRNTATVLGVVFNDTVSSAEAFAKKYGSLYASVDDPNGVIANRYGVTSPPTTFVLNKQGRIVATLVGALSAAQLDTVLARVQ